MHKGHFIKLYLHHLLCFQGNTFDVRFMFNVKEMTKFLT